PNLLRLRAFFSRQWQQMPTAEFIPVFGPYAHAALNPSPPLTQRAVGGGIRATVPLQAALAARSGATATSLLIAALAPAGRLFARRRAMRKVSIT
ncbi:hypothetical protein ACWEV9_31380, partial [Streptomyces albogriseolus]